MFTYCLNNPIICADSDGYETVVVIYDGRSSGWFFGLFWGKGFKRQGQKIIESLEDDGYDVISYSYTTMDEFVSSWNTMAESGEDIYRIYIVGHGAPGSLDCAGKRMKTTGGAYSFDDLGKVNVKDSVYLLCCNGGTPDENGTITAKQLALRTSSRVYAANAGVNIRWSDGKYSTAGTWRWFYPTRSCGRWEQNTVAVN